MSDMTLTEALSRSYMGRLGDRVLDRAMLGQGLVRDWGPPVPVARNYFAYPRLLGSGSWVEVRRNHIHHSRPSITGTAGWRTTTAGLVLSQDSRGLKVTNTSAGTLGSAWAAHPVEAECPVSAAGDVWSWSCQVTNVGTSTVTVAAQIRNNSSAQQVVGSSVVIAPGETKPLSYAGWSAGAGVLYPTLRGVALPAGSEIVMHDVPTLEKVSAVLPAFDGGRLPAGLALPEDFRLRYVGAEHASPSVLEGETITGVSGVRAYPIRSTWAGTPAVRLIPSDANTASYAVIDMPSAVRSGGVLLGTLHLRQQLTGTLNADALRLRSYQPVQASASSPNVAGSYEHRLSYSARTSDYMLQLVHGGGNGSGDVWWTDIALTGPGYTGPAFHGSMPPHGRYSYAWESVPDASASIRSAYP